MPKEDILIQVKTEIVFNWKYRGKTKEAGSRRHELKQGADWKCAIRVRDDREVIPKGEEID